MSNVITHSIKAQRTAEPEVISRFKDFYRELVVFRLDDLGAIYGTEVVFRDPVHELRGLHDLHTYMVDLCARVDFCRFEYLDQLVGEQSAYIKWNMAFAHPSLGSKPILVRGASHVEFTDKIHFHEDIYDLGEMLYEHVPILGGATRWLKKRLAKGDHA